MFYINKQDVLNYEETVFT